MFVEKIVDIVGLYHNPREGRGGAVHRRKSQVQALNRVPAGAGDASRHTGTTHHDYACHGVTSLFAALNIATGEVIS